MPKPTRKTETLKTSAPKPEPAKSTAPVYSQLTRLESESLIRPLLDESDPAYIFKHTLTQETTYGAMLKTKRAELHRQVAEAIEKLSPDQLEQNAAVLALHYERGGWDDLAFVYAALAGDVAWRGYAHREALMHYDSALAIAKRVDMALFAPRVREVFTKRGRVFEVIGNQTEALKNYDAMVAFARSVGDAAMEVEALNHQVTIQALMMGDSSAEMDAQLDRALILAREINDPQLIGRTLWNMGLSRRFIDPTRATQYFKQALELARASNLKELAAYCLTELTVEAQMTGAWRASLDYSRQALEEFRALDNKPMEVDSLANYAEIKYLCGLPEQARKAAQEGALISRTTENLWGTVFNETVLLSLDTDAGEFDRVSAIGKERLEEAYRIGFPPFIGIILQNLIRLHLQLNHLDLADKFADECVRAIEKIKMPIWTALAHGAKAWVLTRRGMFDPAHALLDPLWDSNKDAQTPLFSFMTAAPAIGELALAQGRLDFGLAFCDWLIGRLEPEEAGRSLADALYYRGRIHLARGDGSPAEADLSRARELMDRSQYYLALWRADAELAKLYAQRDETERARAAHSRASDEIHALAAKISNSALRDSFLQQEDAQRVLRSWIRTPSSLSLKGRGLG